LRVEGSGQTVDDEKVGGLGEEEAAERDRDDAGRLKCVDLFEIECTRAVNKTVRIEGLGQTVDDEKVGGLGEVKAEERERDDDRAFSEASIH